MQMTDISIDHRRASIGVCLQRIAAVGHDVTIDVGLVML